MIPGATQNQGLLPGSLGGPFQTPVRQVMSPGVIALGCETTIGACASAMRERRTHAVLIIDDDTRLPCGWVSHQSLLAHIDDDPLTSLAKSAILHDVSVIAPEATVKEAADLMVAVGVTHLLVANSIDSVPEGVVSSWDLVAFYAGCVGRSP